MRIANRLKRLLGITERKSFVTSSSTSWLLMPGGPLAFRSDTVENGIVAASIRWMATAISEAPIIVHDADGPLPEHPASELLLEPNGYYSQSTLLAGIVTSLFLDGNAYVLHEVSAGGRALWYVPHTMVRRIREPNGANIAAYDIRVGGKQVRVEAADIVHLRMGVSLEDPTLGMSPLAGVMREIACDDEAARYTHAILRNMGVPGVLISPKSEATQVTEETAERMKQLFTARFTGERRGEPLVFTGPMEVTPVGFGPQQLSVDTLRRIPEERITAALGIPAIVVGMGAGLERSTFANYAEAREAAYESSVIPLSRNIAADFTRALGERLGLGRGERFAPDLRNVRILQPDLDALAARMDIGVRGGWIRVSEARAALGLPVASEDEVYLRPLTLMPTEGKGVHHDLRDADWYRAETNGRRAAHRGGVAARGGGDGR